MEYTDTNFDFYKINEGEIEHLIEMWKFFNKKDEPYPLQNGKIFLNKKANEVEPIVLLINLAYPVLKTLTWVAKFYNVCMHLRMQHPVKFLYDKFIDEHKGEKKEKIKIDYGEDVPEKPTKKKK